jgi:ABC-type uncharacterized transport system ATPase subunit
LSQEFFGQLEYAIKAADADRVTELLTHLAIEDKASAQTLSRMAEQFDSEGMLRMIQVTASEIQ